MKLSSLFRMLKANTLYWLIAIPVIAISASVITLVLMSWVVTVAVIFELVLPLKIIAVLVELCALIALTLVNAFGKPKGR